MVASQLIALQKSTDYDVGLHLRETRSPAALQCQKAGCVTEQPKPSRPQGQQMPRTVPQEKTQNDSKTGRSAKATNGTYPPAPLRPRRRARSRRDAARSHSALRPAAASLPLSAAGQPAHLPGAPPHPPVPAARGAPVASGGARMRSPWPPPPPPDSCSGGSAVLRVQQHLCLRPAAFSSAARRQRLSSPATSSDPVPQPPLCRPTPSPPHRSGRGHWS